MGSPRLAEDVIDARPPAPGPVRMAVQPIVRLSDGATVGWEALARFTGSEEPPDQWLARAERVGVRAELELRCLEAAVECGPPPDDALLFVNVGPSVVIDERFDEVRRRLPERLVVELTEQAAVDDYDLLRARMQRWSTEGVHLAIDDAGAGYSSLRHVLELSPEFLKLDRSLVHGVDRDRKLQALVHSIAAFAREVGATIVAEGVEAASELEVLRDAGVHLAQGFLLGRPAPPWPNVDRRLASPTRGAHPSMRGAVDVLVDELAHATDARGVCEAACSHLHRLGELMPSVYLVRSGLLRCQAQRGYWQIMDGFPPDVGVLGRAFRSGERLTIGDVDDDDEFVAAVPGLASEIVEPLRVGGEVIGVLSVESVTSIASAAEREISRTARLLEARLAEVEAVPAEGPLARLARSSQQLAGLVDGPTLRKAIVTTACEVGSMGSALLAERVHGAGWVTTATTGPLALVLAALDVAELEQLSAHVERVTSCYTADDPTGRTPLGSERLRAVGVASVAVLPLGVVGRRTGFLLVVDDARRRLSTDDIEALELLGSEAARCIELAAMVAELRNRASTDSLTSLGNHSAFYESLAATEAIGIPFAVLIADIDRFKPVNDQHGHLVGDQLLRDLASRLRAVVRPTDGLYRIGGDELAVLVTDPGPTTACDIAARMRTAAAEVLGPYGASLSIGNARHVDGEPPTATVDRADQALYAAKRS